MMKKYILYLAVALASIVASSASYAFNWSKWEESQVVTGAYKRVLNDKVVGRWFGVAQYGRPSTTTCGAATASMQMVWETHKKGKGIRYNINSLHKFMSMKGVHPSQEHDFLTLEFESGLDRVLEYTNKRFGLEMKVNMTKKGTKSIRDAISMLAKTMEENLSPAVLYGQPSCTWADEFNPRARPYLLATGMFYCPKGTCSRNVIGLFINDSAYNSTAYAEWEAEHGETSPVVTNAVSPRKYLSEKELKSYWVRSYDFNDRPAPLEWLYRYWYLYNSSPEV